MTVFRSLVVIQGPSQALAVLPILRNRVVGQRDGSRSEVHFLIGDLCAAERTPQLLQSTENLLHSLNYRTICNTVDLDELFYRGALSFSEYCRKLRERLTHDDYREVYVCRRMALLNEAALDVSASAKKICYGDGFGCLDNGWPSWCTPRSSRGFKAIDQCRAVMPFEANYRGSTGSPVAVEGVSGLRAIMPVIAQAYARELGRLRESLLPKKEKVCLVTTSNLTESAAVERLADEISLYSEAIMTRPLLSADTLYLVKGHPRETHRQSSLLADELARNGFKAMAIGSELLVPTEVLIQSVRPHEIIPLFSSSGYAARLLDPSIAIRYDMPLGSVFRKWIRATTSNWTLLPEKLQALTLLASYPWDKCLSHLRFLLNALLFRGLSTYFPPFESAKPRDYSTQFGRLQSSPCTLLFHAGSSIAKRQSLVARFAGSQHSYQETHHDRLTGHQSVAPQKLTPPAHHL
jgi:hypothetical protein